jgi:hypothetical protein
LVLIASQTGLMSIDRLIYITSSLVNPYSDGCDNCVTRTAGFAPNSSP